MQLPLVFSCEHATSHMPPKWGSRLGFSRQFLQSHRGVDKGAAWLAKQLAHYCKSPLLLGKVSRLLIDLNRSASNGQRWHLRAERLSLSEKAEIAQTYYEPHWQQVALACLQAMLNHGQVLHLGIHSFTPVFKGQVRQVDIGILYDPSYPKERALALRLLRDLRRALPTLSIYANQPYSGREDGMTTTFRRTFAGNCYMGIEVEVNQARLQKLLGASQKPLLIAMKHLFRSYQRSIRFAPYDQLRKTL